MAKSKWNYGMIEAAFSETEMPGYEEYMAMIESKLADTGRIEPLFSGKISGMNEYWTFVRHRIEPRVMFDFCSNKLAHIKSYNHCYSFKRFRRERMPHIMGAKHRYIGLARIPEAEEFNEEELRELMKHIEASTPFHVAWMSKTHRRDGKNAYIFLTGNVEPGDIKVQKSVIEYQIKAESAEILMIQKFGHHKSHRRPPEEKRKAIDEFMPEDFVDHEWLREYEYYHWSR